MSKKSCKDCVYPALTQTITTSTSIKKIRYCDPLKTIKYSYWGCAEYDLQNLCKCGIDVTADKCPHYKRKWWKFWIREV